MIIDSHEHVMLPTASQIQKMDDAGVDKTILFPTTPHVEKAADGTLDAMEREMQVLYRLLSGRYAPEERIEAMKQSILEVKQAIAFAPNRLYGFGAVPLGLSEGAAADWLETQIIQNRFRGLGEFTPGSEQQVAQLEPILRAAADYHRLPVWVHTFHPVSLDGMKVLMELCRSYSSVPVIFGHMGGTNWMEVIAFAKQNPNAYLDLSAAFTSLSVKTALVEVPERCLFGSDAPFGEPKLTRQLIEFVSPSKQVAKRALGENIAELLRL
ncbi:MAG: TatD family hydrolase [Eubacteriales bacterium]|nr:TatD family hydrolase [Eubacteriales bacterium]